jgi:hypothetical protein
VADSIPYSDKNVGSTFKNIGPVEGKVQILLFAPVSKLSRLNPGPMPDFQPYLQPRTITNRKQDPTTTIERPCVGGILSTEDGDNQGSAESIRANGVGDYQ